MDIYCLVFWLTLFLPQVKCSGDTIKTSSNVSMSLTYSDYGPRFAIDGIYPSNAAQTPENCTCCSITGASDKLWWTIDFGHHLIIGGINITGRINIGDQYQSKGLDIYIRYTSNEVTFAEFGEHVWNVPHNTPGHIFQHIFQPPRLFRFMTITRQVLPNETNHMTICEVDFITAECQPGHYGLNCTEICGHCSDPTTCLVTDGTCPDGCATGYNFTDRMCKTECQPGSYGLNCSETCGLCTDGSTDCSFIDGACPNDCASGYDHGADRTCNTACNDGRFGFRCNDTCGNCSGTSTCNKTDGTCPSGCAQGLDYNADKTCKTKCDPGYYGYNCSETCGHCSDGTTCLQTDGTCPHGCAPGYNYTAGLTCHLECEPGTFGQNCSKSCGPCSDGSLNCSKTTGVCYQRQCAEGYTDESCLEHKSDATPSIVGAIVGTVVLVIVVVVLVVIFKRRGYLFKRNEKGTTGEPDSSFINLGGQERERKKQPNNLGQAETRDNQNISHDNGGYYSFNPGDHATNSITVRDLWDYITSKRANDFSELFEDFQAVPGGCQFECSAAKREENLGKNKYRNMYPYDYCRVILKVPEGQSDYINASHVDGYERRKKFIAAQGPRLGTIEDFWLMIWQQNVRKVVMLTNIFEMGKDKCEQYWPNAGVSVQYGSIHVTMKATKEESDYIMRKLELRMDNEKVRRADHYHFKSWPDKDVPDSAWCLVKFWRVAMDKDQGKSPIVVHCSAGIGRTGTFIALDLLYNQAVTEGGVRPVSVLETLRRQRINLVQTKYQYAYLHEALAEALLIGTHFYWANQLPSVYAFFSGRNPEATDTRAQEQYKLICESISSTDDQQQVSATAAVAPAENIYEEPGEPIAEPEYGNISTTQSEISEYRPRTKDRNSASMQQMNAIYLPNYAEASTYILVETPSDSSLPYFWSLVEEQNVTTIINLTETTHPYYQTSCALGATDDKPVGLFSVRVVKEIEHRDYVSRSIVYGEIGKKDKKTGSTVKMFSLSDWQPGVKCPGDIDPLMALLEEVNKWHPYVSEAKPVLFICGNGRTRCGLVAAIFNESQRMRNEEGHVNIVETVMTMKKKAGDIISEEQFQYLYKAVFTYAKRIGYVVNDDKYQNV